ncbi:MAG TPA: TonB-dependent receptor, partial [Pyrinomonadaceae bacterium]
MTDEAGAVIPGVNITVINVAQVFQRSAITNADGRFVVPMLSPGNYSVKAEHAGFSPAELKDVILNVNDQRDIKVLLKVGSISQTVQIVDASSLIDQSPAVATVVDRQFVSNLPLNGRSFQSLIFLTPGVTPTRTTSQNTGQFSVNGQRTNANYFTVDGVSANVAVARFDSISQQAAGSLPALTSTGGTNNLVSIDALEEFEIQTSTYAPEFGRTAGAQVSLVTRSGTVDFHGSAFNYFRNDVLDANDWFSNSNRLPRAPLRQNLFGGTLSGPVMLPRFGEGSKAYLKPKRTFFFFSYEGLRLRQPQTSVTSVPAISLRQSAPIVIRPILNAFPVPTGSELGATGLAPFAGNFSNPSNLNATSIRLDHSPSGRLTIFGRYNHAPSESELRSLTVPNVITTNNFNTTTATVGANISITPQLLNDLRINFSRNENLNSGRMDNFGGATPFDPALYQGSFAGPDSTLNIFVLTRNFTIGTTNNNLQRQFNIVNHLSAITSNHELKFGIDYRRLSPVYNARDYQLGLFFLTLPSINLARASNVTNLATQRTNPIFNNFSAYAQDTWRTSPRLTLTYGLRWELNPPPKDAGGRHPFVFTGFNNPATATLAPAATALWKTTYNNFAPRFGASFFLSNKTGWELVLRGGVGLFYDLGNGLGGDAFSRPPFTTPLKVLTNVSLPLTTAQISPNSPATDATVGQFLAFDPELKLPYTWQWNFTAEQALGSNQIISAAYVAALGRRQTRNRLFINPNPTINMVNYIDNGSTSDYHALQFQFRRRFSRGLQALASYTWAHAIDEVSDEFNVSTQLRANADFDVRHNLSAAVSYDLPKVGSSDVPEVLLHNWSLDLIVHAQSALPLTVFSQQSALIGAQRLSIRPNLVQNVPVYLVDDLAPGGKRLNRAAFIAPPAGTQGNLGRNILRGFPLNQQDLSLRRRFH